MKDTACEPDSLSLSRRDGRFKTKADIIGDCKHPMTVTLTHHWMNVWGFFFQFTGCKIPQLKNEKLRSYRLDQFQSHHLQSCLIGFGKDETLHNCHRARTMVVFKRTWMFICKGMSQWDLTFHFAI